MPTGKSETVVQRTDNIMTKRKRTTSSRNNEQTRLKFFERFGSTKSKSSVAGFVMKAPRIFLTKRA